MINSIVKTHINLVVITFKTPNLVDDILWPQLDKLKSKLNKYIKNEGFTTLFSFSFSNKDTTGISIACNEKELSKIQKIKGPDINVNINHINRFIDKHKKYYFDYNIGTDYSLRWYLYSKGGDYNKWFGNQDFVINWLNNGHEIKNMFSYTRAQNYYFKEVAYNSSNFFNSQYWHSLLNL